MACEATIVASDTGPVREMITDGETGLMCDFFDVEAMADKIEAVLDRPSDYAHLGPNAGQKVRDHLSLDVCLPKLKDYYSQMAGRPRTT